jgi:hypothetical protein
LAVSARAPLATAPTARGRRRARILRSTRGVPPTWRNQLTTLPPSVKVPSRSKAATTGEFSCAMPPFSQGFGHEGVNYY